MGVGEIAYGKRARRITARALGSERGVEGGGGGGTGGGRGREGEGNSRDPQGAQVRAESTRQISKGVSLARRIHGSNIDELIELEVVRVGQMCVCGPNL